jgi:hypothetical protein
MLASRAGQHDELTDHYGNMSCAANPDEALRWAEDKSQELEAELLRKDHEARDLTGATINDPDQFRKLIGRYRRLEGFLEATLKGDAKPALTSMRDNGREMDVTWQQGAAEAFKKAGFVNRVGSTWDHAGESGQIKVPSHGGHANIQGIHILFNKNETTKGDVHIDYRWGIDHWSEANDDVTKNYNTYKRWYGEVPGYKP